MRNRLPAISMIFLVGCAAAATPTPQQSQQLHSGYQALNQGNPDTALKIADDYLHNQPDGPGTAEAWYLRGRSFEQRGGSDPSQIRQNLDSARTAYQEALKHNPSPKTEGYLHASLSNVAFFEDDFHTALSEATRAYDMVDSADIQSLLLYRIGVSQQRLGHFTDADHTFDLVQMRFPTTPLAQLAHQRQGTRSFFVQLATFSTPAGADRAADALKSTGLTLTQHPDPAGHIVLDAGPYTSYQSAQQVEQQFTTQFPQALIIP